MTTRFLSSPGMRFFPLLFALSLHACGHGGDGQGGASLPSAPTDVAATAASKVVTVQWSPVVGATSYKVYRASTSGVNKSNYGTLPNGDQQPSAASPFLDINVTNGTTYYYVVTAVNAVGESAESSEVFATPTSTNVPSAPIGLKATASAGQVTLEWNSSTDAASYFVYMATVSGINRNNWNTIVGGKRSQVIGGATQYIATGLTNGTTYYFVVTALNDVGQSLESNQVSATPFASVTVPSPPGNLSATPGDQKVTLRWDNATGATSYKIYWGTASGVKPSPNPPVQSISNVSSPYVHTGRSNGTTYYYIVVGVNDRGESLPSSEISAIPNPTPPPGVVTLAPTNITLSGSATLNGKILPNGFPVTEAYFEYGVTTAYGTKVPITQNFGSGNNFVDVNPMTISGLASNTPYHYRLAAKNVNGAAFGDDQTFVLPFFTALYEFPVGAGASPNDVIVADLNGDGRLDFATANNGTNDVSILFGTGNFGTPSQAFTAAVHYAVGAHPKYLAVGNFHGSGKPPDLVVSNSTDGTITLLSNNGSGVFSATSFPIYNNLEDPTKSFPAGLAVADFNGDGNLDVAVAASITLKNSSPSTGNGRVVIFLGDGSGGFAPPSEFPAGISPTGIVAGDFDLNGTVDLVVTNRIATPGTISLLSGDGQGNFGAPSSFEVGSDATVNYDPAAVVAGDFNGDHFLDVAVADNASSTVSVFLNNTTGGFDAAALLVVGLQPPALGLTDFTGDPQHPRLDLIVPNFHDNSVSVYLGTGTNAFGPSFFSFTGASPVAVATGDFDGDQKVDLAVANTSANTVSILLGQ